MNFKPRVIFLQDILDMQYGSGTTRVICPITDPYVVHHGALGSFVRVYCQSPEPERLQALIHDLDGIAAVYRREEACARFDLPADREGDLVVIGDRETAIGTTQAEHDLSDLGDSPLRSHGGTAEQTVPFILSERLSDAYTDRASSQPLRNFDLLDYALNGMREG